GRAVAVLRPEPRPADRVPDDKSPTRVPQVGDLPPPNTGRWLAGRKAAVVAGVRDDRITMEEALHRYQLTREEFLS
ncbi:MAG TPA: DUF1153 domain-containing protein, partial [Stellaceae bacterium]|nr:DUF1153 domain-containing protein [Stellaceae bacterium]